MKIRYSGHVHKSVDGSPVSGHVTSHSPARPRLGHPQSQQPDFSSGTLTPLPEPIKQTFPLSLACPQEQEIEGEPLLFGEVQVS